MIVQRFAFFVLALAAAANGLETTQADTTQADTTQADTTQADTTQADTTQAEANQACKFALTSKIFVGRSDSAVSEHRILFDQGMAFDLSLTENRFTTLYDVAHGTIRLLDRKSEVQAAVQLQDLLSITAQVKASANRPEDRQRLGLDAQVKYTDRYSIEFAGTRYVVETEKPSDVTIAKEYGRFADLALRMNILRPHGPPPFARMALNSHIAAKGEFPVRSSLTVDRGEIVDQFRSTNEIEALTEADHKSIAEIRDELAVFRQVPIKEFPLE